MMKHCVILGLFLVFTLSLSGATYWYIGPDMGDYDEPTNWNGSVVPGSTDVAGVNNADGKGPVLSAGMSEECLDFNVGQLNTGSDSKLYFDGGILAVDRNFYAGRIDAAAKGTVVMTDPNSLLDVTGSGSLIIGQAGTGILEITSGTVKANLTDVGLDAAETDQGGSGEIHLNDPNSIFHTDRLFMNPAGPSRAKIDLAGGVLVIDAYYHETEVLDWIANGQITAYGGNPLASITIEWIDYDGTDGGDMETVVTAELLEVADCHGAGTAWYVGAGVGYWFDGSVWNLGGTMPCAQTNAGSNRDDGSGPEVPVGFAAECLTFTAGANAGGADSTLTISGGTLDVGNHLYIGKAGATGTVTLTGDTSELNSGINILLGEGAGGTGNLIVDGGMVDTKYLRLAKNIANVDTTGNVHMELKGGEVWCDNLLLHSAPAPGQVTIDVTDGVLIVDLVDRIAELTALMNAGDLTAFGSNPNTDPLVSLTIEWKDYDGNGDGETVVSATKLECVPGWSDADLDEDCDVDIDDLKIVAAEWADSRQLETLWDIDFSSDVITDGLFTDRDPGTSQYNYTDVAGMLHYTQPTVFDGVDNYYFIDDAHVVFSAKADDTDGIALWHEFLSDSTQRFVSWIRVMKDASDPTKQVVEFLKGSVDWGVIGTQGAQDAVYVYGFSADDVLTITGDYTVDEGANTVTLDWEVTDGVTTQSGSNVVFAPLSAALSGPWTITLWGPGTGYFDQLTYDLYVSPAYDLTGDNAVDFADFEVIASDWATTYQP